MEEIYKRKTALNPDEYIKKLDLILEVLSSENPDIREKDRRGISGGVIQLHEDIPTIIVPDLHARVNFIKNLLEYKIENRTVLDLLHNKEIQIVCVGDGFHSERRARDRWLLATAEFEKGFKKHRYMDEEMCESLTLMELIIELKIEFPENFHFLKGNHENILNEDIEGNRPFGKFTFEGAMVKEWVLKFYGAEFMEKYYCFEKKMPLFVIGKNFLISHAEPKRYYNKNELVNCYVYSDIIYDLTWTRNNEAEEGSVIKMLNEFNKDYYFSGHRPVKEKYNLRAYGKLIQLHNPERYIIALINTDKEIDPDRDIIDIGSQENGVAYGNTL